jgi:hypothetical protein
VVKFSEELTIPGPRIPVTASVDVFDSAAELGRRLIWLHSFGERLVPGGLKRGAIPEGSARCVTAVSSKPSEYPESWEFDAATQELRVGDGVFSPVTEKVFQFSISGLQIVKSWLDYRKKSRTGKASSPLDEVRPERWTADFTEELLRVLWVLEATVEMTPELDANLARIVAGDTFNAGDLPSPSDDERRPPETAGATQATLGFGP